MIDINLLPWREQRRDLSRKQFFVQLGLIAVLGIVISASINSIIGQCVRSQVARNAVFTSEIQQMTQTNKKMKNIKQERDQLIIQLKKLQQLHNSRFQLVNLFNGLVHVLPDGVHLTEMQRINGKITIRGIASNHGEVTHLLRNIHKSTWFIDPELSEVTDDSSGASKVFRLTMLQQQYGENHEA